MECIFVLAASSGKAGREIIAFLWYSDIPGHLNGSCWYLLLIGFALQNASSYRAAPVIWRHFWDNSFGQRLASYNVGT